MGNSGAGGVLGALARPCPAATEAVMARVECVGLGCWQEGWWDGCELPGSAGRESSHPCCGWDGCRGGLGERNASFSRGDEESVACLA